MVSQVRESMASISNTCHKRMLEIEQERLEEEAIAMRWEAIKARRVKPISRNLAFGNVAA